MNGYELIGRASATTADVVRAVSEQQGDAATPCADWTVRDLANHLLYWGPSLVGAAGKQLVAPPEVPEQDAGLATERWPARVVAQLEAIAAAWADPAAWVGTTRMGGPSDLPAPLVGGMVCTEVVVHGWDLARATGQRPTWDGEVTAFVLAEIDQSAQMGREYGIYQPPVPTAADASVLDRAVALTGRDPRWAAATATAAAPVSAARRREA